MIEALWQAFRKFVQKDIPHLLRQALAMFLARLRTEMRNQAPAASPAAA